MQIQKSFLNLDNSWWFTTTDNKIENESMKLKHVTVLVACVAAAGLATVVRAADPASATDTTGTTDYKDPDLIHIDYPNNNPHTKANYRPDNQRYYSSTPPRPDPDLVHMDLPNNNPHTKANYRVPVVTSSSDPDLARNIRYMDGSPKAKSSQNFQIAPLK